MNHPTEKPDFLKFAGRRKGRPLRDGRENAFQHIQENFSIPQDKVRPGMVPQAVFDEPYEKFWLEVGFGNGEHLIGQAERNRDIGMIGCEPFINGVSAAAKDVMSKNLTNVRFWADDAFLLLPQFKEESFDRIFLLFSDPWPKTRQHKRRVVQTQSVALFAKLLKKSGILRLATDHKDLAEWMLIHTVQNEHLVWKNASDGEWHQAPSDWIETRYQQKAAREGRPAYFMDFTKR